VPTRLVLYEGVIQTYITEQATQFVTKTAEEVMVAAKVMAPKRSGLLAASIHMTPLSVRGLQVSTEVGSDQYYALIAHNGSRPHEEHAAPGEVLYLGPLGFSTYVHHPGTRGTPYLTEPLQRVGHRLNFIVTPEHVG
jgi:hypothetical protein